MTTCDASPLKIYLPCRDPILQKQLKKAFTNLSSQNELRQRPTVLKNIVARSTAWASICVSVSPSKILHLWTLRRRINVRWSFLCRPRGRLDGDPSQLCMAWTIQNDAFHGTGSTVGILRCSFYCPEAFPRHLFEIRALFQSLAPCPNTGSWNKI